MEVDDLPERLDRWADAGDFGRGPSKTDLRRLSSARIRTLEVQIAELQEKASALRTGWLNDMRRRGVVQSQAIATINAALQRKEPQG